MITFVMVLEGKKKKRIDATLSLVTSAWHAQTVAYFSEEGAWSVTANNHYESRS